MNHCVKSRWRWSGTVKGKVFLSQPVNNVKNVDKRSQNIKQKTVTYIDGELNINETHYWMDGNDELPFDSNLINGALCCRVSFPYS